MHPLFFPICFQSPLIIYTNIMAASTSTSTIKKTTRAKATTSIKSTKKYIKIPRQRTKPPEKKQEIRAAKSVLRYGDFVEGWDNQLGAVFNTESEYFDRMMTIIDSARKLNIAHSDGNHAHHIIPRSYFNKYNKEVDNSERNLVVLTPQQHFIVHYYAWKCAHKVMKTSMAYAFRMMYALAGKKVEETNAIVFSKAFNDMWNTKMKIKKESLIADYSTAAPKNQEKFLINVLSAEVGIKEFPALGKHPKRMWEEFFGVSWMTVERAFTVEYQKVDLVEVLKESPNWRETLNTLRVMLEHSEADASVPALNCVSA